MYLKQCGQTRLKRDGAYWELVESYRTERGPRQRIVSYLRNVGETRRLGMQQAARGETVPGKAAFFEKREPVFKGR